MHRSARFAIALLLAAFLPWSGSAQGPGQGAPGVQGGPPGPGRQGGPGMQQERKVVAQFDRDGDKRLNAAERREARAWLETQPAAGPGRGRGGPGRGGAPSEPPAPGERLAPAQVKPYTSESFYDPTVLRTLFFQFENNEWEKELEIFSNTDVEVPATLTVDGKVYKDVGLSFRGASSLFGVGMGQKRSLNVAVDSVHENQNVGGYRSLNLLNSHVDPTLPANDALHAGGARPDAGAEGELRPGGPERRELGRVRQRAAVQQGVHQRVVQDH